MGKIIVEKLTKQEYKRIMANAIHVGGESIICRTPFPNEVYKFFTYGENLDSENAYPNKRKKLETLYEMPNLMYMSKPISIVETEDIFTGYKMTYDEQDISLATAILTPQETYLHLKKLKFILEYLKTRGIVHGDVQSKNILVNPVLKTTKVCDIDNSKIGPFQIDVMEEEMLYYTDTRGKVDSTADMYMYNLLTLQQLSYRDATYAEILNLIEKGIYPQNFRKEANQVLESMLNPRTYDGKTIIEYAKRK